MEKNHFFSGAVNAVGMSICVWALIFGLVSYARAGEYIGVGLNHSRQVIDTSVGNAGTYGSQYDYSETDQNLQGYIGYSWGRWAAEFGGGGLGLVSAHNVEPGKFDIQQDIETRFVYLQAVYSFPVTSRLALRASAGVARVWMKNHEYGCNPCPGFVEQVNYSVATRPIVGVGLRLAVTDALALRLDVAHMRNVAESHWTLSSDVTTALASVQVGF